MKAKLTLAERVYQCDGCGLVLDRDVNAARNLLLLAASGADSLNACGAAVRPGLTAGRAALKQEPGTATRVRPGPPPTRRLQYERYKALNRNGSPWP